MKWNLHVLINALDNDIDLLIKICPSKIIIINELPKPDCNTIVFYSHGTRSITNDVIYNIGFFNDPVDSSSLYDCEFIREVKNTDVKRLIGYRGTRNASLIKGRALIYHTMQNYQIVKKLH